MSDIDTSDNDNKYNEPQDSTLSHSVEARKDLRDRMAKDIEAFLAKGGKIQKIEANVLADPPTKPKADYGGRLI